MARVDPESGRYDSVQVAAPAGLATGDNRDTVRSVRIFLSILVGVVVGECTQYGVQLIEIGGNGEAEIAQPIGAYQQGMLGEPTVEARRYGIDFTVIQWLVPLFVVGTRRQDVLAILLKQIVQRPEHPVFRVLPDILEHVTPEELHHVGIVSGGQHYELLFAVVGGRLSGPVDRETKLLLEQVENVILVIHVNEGSGGDFQRNRCGGSRGCLSGGEQGRLRNERQGGARYQASCNGVHNTLLRTSVRDP